MLVNNPVVLVAEEHPPNSMLTEVQKELLLFNFAAEYRAGWASGMDLTAILPADRRALATDGTCGSRWKRCRWLRPDACLVCPAATRTDWPFSAAFLSLSTAR